MSWDKDEYERTRLAYNKARDDERTHQEVAKAMAVLKKHGVLSDDEDLETLRQQHGQYEAALLELADERDRLTQDLSKDHQAAELARMRQGIRNRDHFDAWKELATEAGMNPKAIRHSWQEAQANGFKAESDEVDRKALGALVDGMRSTHDYFWPQDPTPLPAEPTAARENEPAASGARFTFQNGAWKSNGAN